MVVGIILLAVVIYLAFNYVIPKKPKNFPPGPPMYPVVGSGPALAKLGTTGSGAFRKLGEVYGPISGIALGKQLAVVINGYETSKAFYALDEFSHRPELFTFSYRWGGRMLGVFFSNGRLWQEQRRFTLRHLRDFGFGKTSMEGLIHEECAELIETLKKTLKEEGPVITINDRFAVSLINILWATMAGVRYRHDDANFKEMLKIIQVSLRTGSVRGNIVNSFPFLRHLPYFNKEFKMLTEGFDAACKMVEKAIDEHVKTRDPSETPRDLIDVYLNAMEERKNEPNSTFFREQLVQTCADLFGAGAETTSNSVSFALLHVLRHPEVQEKVQKELDTFLGKERVVSYDDRQSLPYTYATITEAFRVSPIAPVSVPHTSTQDTTFMGYDVPKGTFVVVNFPSTNMDKKYWGDPENFRPERFLNTDGTFDKTKLEHVLGFGAGRRQCLGEPLARITNFILIATVLHRFKLEIVPGQPKPTAEPVDGLTIAPQPFSAKVTPRF